MTSREDAGGRGCAGCLVPVIAVCVVFYLLGHFLFGCGDPFLAKEVPDVTGSEVGQAEERVRETGLDAEIVGDSGWFDDDPVCRQNPKPGAKTRGDVTLYIAENCPNPSANDSGSGGGSTGSSAERKFCGELSRGENDGPYSDEELEDVAGVDCP